MPQIQKNINYFNSYLWKGSLKQRRNHVGVVFVVKKILLQFQYMITLLLHIRVTLLHQINHIIEKRVLVL